MHFAWTHYSILAAWAPYQIVRKSARGCWKREVPCLLPTVEVGQFNLSGRTLHFFRDGVWRQKFFCRKCSISKCLAIHGVWGSTDENDKNDASDIMIEDLANGLWHVMGQTFGWVGSSRNEKIVNFAQKLEETIFVRVPMNLPSICPQFLPIWRKHEMVPSVALHYKATLC